MKYHNKKITYEGNTFDSKKELNRYIELQWLQRSGKISELQRQQAFELIPAQYEYNGLTNDGKSKRKCIERAVTYIADFTYLDEYGSRIVEDTKGFKTAEYIIKRKLMLYMHGIRIQEI